MPRPASGYRLKDGTRVPANGTIREQWGLNKRPLMFWANKKGLEGKSLQDAEQEETTIGTIIHALIEADLRGREAPSVVYPQEWKDRIENGMLGYYEWRSSSNVTVTHSEIELVSEVHKFGTTPDFPSLVSGRRSLIQLKTADNIYPDFYVQIAAEGKAWDEKFPDDPVQRYDLLLVGKGDGSFTHKALPIGAPKIVAGWEVFLLLRALYEQAKALK